MTQTPDPTLTPGTVFQGRYEILTTLGAGGCGRVYKARQYTTGQAVALKVLNSRAADALELRKQRRRFVREMRLCAQLSHPQIVPLIDSGQTEDERLFMVFAYVPGKTLGQLLKEEGQLSASETTFLMGQVLDALEAAHKKGVIHRDLKPDNIMVTWSGVRRNATVLDFGIGAFVGPGGEDALRQLTCKEGFFGTPRYAAPEHIRGGPPTERADIYAWGLVFLECLTGKPAIRGRTIADILYEQLTPEPVPIPADWKTHPLGEIIEKTVVWPPGFSPSLGGPTKSSWTDSFGIPD